MACQVDSTVASKSDTEALLEDGCQTSSEEDTAELLGRSSEISGAKEVRGIQSRENPAGTQIILFLKAWWRFFVIILTPIMLVPLPIILWKHTAARASYAIAIIAVYWITEVVPIAVTALLPMILFPALGVLSARDTAVNYLTDTNMLFVGGLMMAVAIEKWNLHKRIALLVLMAVGSKPRWLLLGFMGTTAFLSMWISNTATAAMMLPIAHAVLEEIREENKSTSDSDDRLEAGEGTTLAQIKLQRKYDSVGESRQVYLELTNQESEDPGNSSEGQPERSSKEGSAAFVENEAENQLAKVDAGENAASEEDVCSDPHQQQLTVSTDTQGTSSDGEASSSERRDKETLKSTDNDNQTASDSADSITFKRMAKVLTLGVAYSANIGGTATLTGTGPNLVLSGVTENLFPESPLNFGVWFAFATPAMILSLFCCWIYLSLLYCDDSFQWCKRKLLKRKAYTLNSQRAKQVIRKQYKRLGPIKYAEVLVLLLFILLALLWLFREPKFIDGWGSFFETDRDSGQSYFSDASTALFIIFLLFVIPSKPCFSLDCLTRSRSSAKSHSSSSCIEAGSSPRLLDWNSVQHKLPWNVVILLGSGFALAEGAEQSGLSDWLGSQLLGLQHLPKASIALFVSIIVASATEVISNVATTTLFLPVLAQLAVDLCINPLYLMIPATVSASYAFMLPVATPPNAIAFSYGYIKVSDMVLTGVLMNLICIGIVTLALNTIGVAIFDLGTFPSWANSTASGACFNTSVS